MTSIAFIGLGNMGLPMAKNLHKGGYSLRVFDLALAPLEEMKELGATAAASAAEACKDADIVISMLPAGKHVVSLYLENGLLSVIDKNALVIDCSTIDTQSANAVHKASKDQGISMLDAPVSGGVAAAAAGTLTFMCGGTNEDFEKAKPILSAMGANIFLAGGDGAGQVAKMCNNMLLAIHMIGTSEALKLGENNGLDAKVLSEIMLASSGKNWSLEKYNPFPGVMENAPASNDYKPGFMVDLMTKDLGLAISNAKDTNSNTPLGQAAFDMYKKKQASGDGLRDFSSIIELL
jgi:3-hydroxyisobutyrate dehydrogenase